MELAIIAFLAGMIVAWKFIPEPQFLKDLFKSKTGYTSPYAKKNIGDQIKEFFSGNASKFAGILAALVALVNTGIFKNATGVLGQFRDLILKLSGVLKSVGLAAASMVGWNSPRDKDND